MRTLVVVVVVLVALLMVTGTAGAMRIQPLPLQVCGGPADEHSPVIHNGTKGACKVEPLDE